MPKYGVAIKTEQRLVIEVPPGTEPFIVEDGFAKFRNEDGLVFLVPASDILRCEKMPEESPIVKPE